MSPSAIPPQQRTVLSALRTIAASRGMTDADVARAYGCKPQYIFNLWRNRNSVSLGVLVKLADVLGVDVDVRLEPKAKA